MFDDNWRKAITFVTMKNVGNIDCGVNALRHLRCIGHNPFVFIGCFFSKFTTFLKKPLHLQSAIINNFKRWKKYH